MGNHLLKYGTETISISIPNDNLLGVLEAEYPKAPCEADEYSELQRAMRNPIGSRRLGEIAGPGMKTVILCSDITRPSPSKKMLPILLDELNGVGVRDGDITIVFGLGIHRPHTRDEHEYLVGKEIYGRVRCADSIEAGFKLVGKSSRGTPYYVNAFVAECDLLICTGNIEYHYFAGYSGGAKAVLPGASDKETIDGNHRMMTQPGCGAGILNGNPVRADIDEIASFVKIDFILNVVINENKQILKAFAGDYIAAHREGCRYLDTIYKKQLRELADIVIACSGGFPKDINMYQAQKALDNARFAVKPGGAIIWIGRCVEGYGEKTFEAWVNESSSPESLVERIKREFVVGGHKAAAIGAVLCKHSVDFVTDMDKSLIERLYIKHHKKEELQALIDRIIMESGGCAKFYIMPQAGSILPAFEET